MADIDTINEQHVVDSQTDIPDDIKYSTNFNRDRASINAALFQERCKRLYLNTGSTEDSVMIFSDNITEQNGSKTYEPFENCTMFW